MSGGEEKVRKFQQVPRKTDLMKQQLYIYIIIYIYSQLYWFHDDFVDSHCLWIFKKGDGIALEFGVCFVRVIFYR